MDHVIITYTNHRGESEGAPVTKTAPLSPAEELTNTGYASCARQWASDHSSPGYWADEMDTFHRLLPAGSILEIGAGGGRDAKELTARGYNYLGTDISPEMLTVAREELPTVEFQHRSVYDLETIGREFDGFWASAVLLHIPRQRIDVALRQIRTVVRPGGIGFISLKDGAGETVENEDVHGVQLRRLFVYWTKADFATVLDRNGYDLVRYSYHPRSPRTRWHSFIVQSRAAQRRSAGLF